MSVVQVDSIEKVDGSPVDLTKQSAAKALASLNGTGTIALRDSGLNVSSVLDVARGVYRYNYTNAFANLDYIAHGGGFTDNSSYNAFGEINGLPGMQLSSTELKWIYSSIDTYDVPYATLTVHGELA
ncbi:hypothetical protein [Curvivirga aplysinae]|uniref:hypothetical protein n=1 Tax=Curvivirga aplysinae TaxID=2529852 RepID=UPI001C3F6DF0|nr:hypothetical protein [Curvivirga aplysinae]